MRKIFWSSTYLLLIIMEMVYLCTSGLRSEILGSSGSLLNMISFTGLSVIGFIFTMPAFVFVILSISLEKKTIEFWKNMFCLLSSFFCLITAGLGLAFCNIDLRYYIPIILALVSALLFVSSLIFVIKGINEEKKEEANAVVSDNTEADSEN